MCRDFFFSSCSIAKDLSGGLSFLLARALASFFTSLVMWRKCSLKTSMGLTWTKGPHRLLQLIDASMHQK